MVIISFTNRLNNPNYLKLFCPLNSATDDRSGNNNTVTPTAITYAENKFGLTSAVFNGTTSFIDLTSNLDDFRDLSEGSISLWFNTNDLVNFQRLISASDKASVGKQFFYHLINAQWSPAH